MPTEFKTGLSSVISNFTEFVFTIIEETKQTARFVLKKSFIHNFPIPKNNCNTYPMSTKYISSDIIRSVNPIYVLTNNMMKLDNPIQSSITKYILSDFNCIPQTITEKPTNITTNSINLTNLKPSFGSAKDFKIEKAHTLTLKPETFQNPNFSQLKPQISAKILKRSESFPTNIPLEKKPLDLFLLNDKELDFFRINLAQKFNLSKFAVKLAYIYTKCNVKNLQNIKFDNKTKCLYCNFKPKSKLVNDNDFSYLVFGTRIENNTSISATVSQRDFDDFKKQF